VSSVAQRVLWRIRAQVAPRPRVLAYHRIERTELPDPFGMYVAPEQFAQHLEWLRSRYRPMSLPQFLAARATGIVPRNAVVVTFDDGYADNVSNALPLLERFEVPATFFIAAGYVGSGREFWWDALERIIATRRDLVPEMLAALGLDARSSGAGAGAAFAAVRDGLLELPASRCSELLAGWQVAAGVDGAMRPTHRVMDAEELRRLAAHRLVTIGAHGVNHLDLTRLDDAARRHEIGPSRRQIEAYIDRPVRYFAYPFGACDVATEAAVRSAGFEAAFTTDWAPVTRRTGPWRMPRLMISGAVERLARALAGTG
jgi:peptidoglycan/xylan/chitin deacetylase (PgdA/CDA1 family)